MNTSPVAMALNNDRLPETSSLIATSGIKSAEEELLEKSESGTYVTAEPWNSARPRVLVVACSDGRIQKNLDDFLHSRQGITSYDRMYMPGGPGALASSGYEFLRGDNMCRECSFLIEAHVIEHLFLVFHGAAADGDAFDGPPEATCADYRRKLPTLSVPDINKQHVADYHDIVQKLSFIHPNLFVHGYRAEVINDGSVRFVNLKD